MLKKIILSISLSLSLFAFDAQDYSYMLKDHVNDNGEAKNKSEIIKEFGKINNNVNYDFAKDFEKKYVNKFKGMSYEQAKQYVETFYKPNEFLTKEESLTLLDYVFSVKNFNKKYSQDFILYFTTESVPKDSMANIMLSLSALQEEGINIEMKEYMTGPSDNLQTYLYDWKDYINQYPIKYQNNIVRNFHLKFDPRFFKVYEIKKAPAMALAHCQSMYPEPKTCKIDYFIRGDVSLLTFFDKISKMDKRYIPYKKILESKGIYKLDKDSK